MREEKARGKENDMKRISVKWMAWICAIFIFVLTFASCSSSENKIESEAVNAYLKYTIDHTEKEDSSFLYVTDGKIVTVVNGKATGVYTERAEAMAAIFDDSETDGVDESVYYVAKATSLDGLFVCGQSPVFSAVHQEASAAYKQYVVFHMAQKDSELIYQDEGLFVPIQNGIVGNAKFTLKSAMENLFGNEASSYELKETIIDGLHICVRADR